jgi:hypothetical protein
MRTVPPKPLFTFSDGTTVTLERVGPLIAAEIQSEHPAPQPPLAPGVDGALEPNPADPDYAAALEQHATTINLLITDAYLDLGVSDDIAVDEAAVARVRRYQASRGKDISHLTDKVVYLKYILMRSEADIGELLLAIVSYDRPTEGAISAAEAAFRSDVSRDRSEDAAPTAFGSAVQRRIGAGVSGEVGRISILPGVGEPLEP